MFQLQFLKAVSQLDTIKSIKEKYTLFMRMPEIPRAFQPFCMRDILCNRDKDELDDRHLF